MTKEMAVIKMKELREASVALNDSGLLSEKLKVVAIAKNDLQAEFVTAMVELEDAEVPEVAVKLYKKIVDAEKKPEEPDDVPEDEDAYGKPKAGKESETSPGVIGTILQVIADKGPVSKGDILAKLIQAFPERDPDKMAKTLNCQISGKKRPLRMEREKGVTFTIDSYGRYSL